MVMATRKMAKPHVPNVSRIHVPPSQAVSGRKPTIAGMNARRRLATLGVAVGGVLVGHWLTYLLASPEGHARAHLLRSGGHAYLGLANDAGLVLALAALASIFLGRLIGDDEGSAGIARRLVTFQIGAFLTMELLERITAGDPLAPLFHLWILPIGIVAQCLAALAGARLTRLVLRAADRANELFGTPDAIASRGIVAALRRLEPLVPSRLEVAAVGVRGPLPRI